VSDNELQHRIARDVSRLIKAGTAGRFRELTHRAEAALKRGDVEACIGYIDTAARLLAGGRDYAAWMGRWSSLLQEMTAQGLTSQSSIWALQAFLASFKDFSDRIGAAMVFA